MTSPSNIQQATISIPITYEQLHKEKNQRRYRTRTVTENHSIRINVLPESAAPTALEYTYKGEKIHLRATSDQQLWQELPDSPSVLAKNKILFKELHPHEVSQEITEKLSSYIFINGKAYTKANEPIYSVSCSNLTAPERYADMELNSINAEGKIASEGNGEKKFFRADQFEEAKKYCIENNTGKYKLYKLKDSMIEKIDQQKITVVRPEVLKYGQVQRFATELKLEITISIETEGISSHVAMQKAIAQAEEQFFPLQCNGCINIQKETTHILPEHADTTPLHLKTAKGQSTLHYKPSKNNWHCKWKSKNNNNYESQDIPITNWTREYRLSLLYLYTLYKIAFPNDWYVSAFDHLSEEEILDLGKLPLHQLIQNWTRGNITPETSSELAQVLQQLTKNS